MTIANQYATCDPAAVDFHVDECDLGGSAVRIALRPHELLLGVRRLPYNARTPGGIEVVAAKTCWDHRITSDFHRGGPDTWERGEDWFETNRHADGTTCGFEERRNPDTGEWENTPRTQCRCVIYDVPCPDCGAINSHVVTQLAYGDETTCRTDGCDYRRYYSIGD